MALPNWLRGISVQANAEYTSPWSSSGFKSLKSMSILLQSPCLPKSMSSKKVCKEPQWCVREGARVNVHTYVHVCLRINVHAPSTSKIKRK